MALTFAHANAVLPDHALFTDVSWTFYQSLLEEIGDGTTRVTFDRGRMEIMSPLGEHERYKKRFALFLETLMLDFEVPFASYGSTTFNSENLQRGLEPDECYYIAHEATVRDKDRFDLEVDPPPDLVLEMDITHRAIDREAIYAAMGVPEVWRYDGATLDCLVLNPRGQYEASEYSRSLPFLKPADLLQFLNNVPPISQNQMIANFRRWLKTVPR